MRLAVLLIAAVAGVLPAAAQRSTETDPASLQQPPLAHSEMEKRILDTITAAVGAGELYANVPAIDGRMMRVLAESVNAKQVLEIGTSTGISGLWFLLALERTGGHLTTLEIDPMRASLARQHFQRAGVEGLVTLIEGDAHQNIAKVHGPVDVVFIDAEKDGYVDYLKRVLPLVRPGGLILAHNVDMVPAYVKTISGNSALETVYYLQGNQLAITLKKR
jgi:predicted O-methyltransferase YrrM